MISDEFAAGFFDGEGCVSCARAGGHSSPKIRVDVGSSVGEVLYALQERYGGGISICSYKNPNWKDSFRWSLSGERMFTFLKAIQPYSIVKKPVISVALEYEWCYPRLGHSPSVEVVAARWEARERIRALNKRGKM